MGQCCGRCLPCMRRADDAARLAAERAPLLGDQTVHLQLEGTAASRYAIKEVIGYGSTSSVHLCEKLGTSSAGPASPRGSIQGGVRRTTRPKATTGSGRASGNDIIESQH